MLDLHTHLDLYPNPLNLVRIVNNKNDFTLSMTTSPKAWVLGKEIFKPYSNIYCALGLHPEIIDKKRNELDLLFSNIPKTRFIGEVGLDFSSQHVATFDLQYDTFDKILKCAASVGGRIISVHSRNATKEVLKLISSNESAGIVILHWFSGSKIDLYKALDLGCMFSVNPIMTKGRKGQSIISEIPISSVFPESDGPFAALSGRSIMPWETSIVSDYYAHINNFAREYVENSFKENLCRILKTVEVF